MEVIFVLNTLELNFPKIFCVKFDWPWPGGSREDSQIYFRYNIPLEIVVDIH